MTQVGAPKHGRPTEGEVRVLEEIVKGSETSEIATALSLETDTIKTHLRRISKDTKSKNRTQIAVKYIGWKYGGWEIEGWDRRRLIHKAWCQVFTKDDDCDCDAQRRATSENHRPTEGQRKEVSG